MDAAERRRLEEKGFRVGTVAEFLGLSEAESELLEIKLSLTDALNERRRDSSVTQSQLAEQIGSSQSRVAKMEAGDPHVSLDLIIRALLALGMTRKDLAQVFSPEPAATLPSYSQPTDSNGSSKRTVTRPPRAAKVVSA